MSDLHEQARCAVLALADEAIEATLAGLYERHAELYRRFGEPGRRACREDLRFHLAYLDGALAARDAAVFGAYIAWLAGVLESRGVPTVSLATSIDLLTAFFTARLPAAGAAAVAAILAGGSAALCDPAADPSPNGVLSGAATALTAHRDAPRLAELLTQGDRAGARVLAESAQGAGLSYLELGVALFQSALYRVGDLWRANRVSVAQEHLATALTQSYLANAYARAEFAPRQARQVLCACVAGNLHALGPRLVADAFEIAGWEASYLGANVPTRDLVAFADWQKPALIALSVSTATQIAALREALTALRGELGSRCPPLLVGGLAVNALPDLWRRLGADEWRADALGVGALARE